MKTAISIPDEIFEEAEKLAKRRGMSRSELYSQAIADFVIGQRSEGVRERLNAIYASNPELSELDPGFAKLQWASMGKDDW